MLLHKLEEKDFPDEMTESNTVHIGDESFFIVKMNSHIPDCKKFWWAYNWRTRNKIVGRKIKEEVYYLLCTYYEKHKDKDK